MQQRAENDQSDAGDEVQQYLSFMLGGQSYGLAILNIKELIEYFKIDVKDVFVFHDDMDIDLGKVKVKFGGSNAGHNGIESIDKNIGKNYSRIRIGIGRPKDNSNSADHVLDNFSIDEKGDVQEVTKNIINSISILIDKDLDLFSSKINQK